ncbi:uroplakin-1a [Brachyhypopomus gauderio]|uniref:uroplakin-1a n=1 Tax=Brachyhypopomus gauderio TaxID=698409 RepID=UPI004041464A
MASSGGMTCLMAFLIICNIFSAAAGLALCALAIWVTVDPYQLYPISAMSGKTDIFAAAWIAIFTGFAYFCTNIFGIFAALKKSRCLMLTYLIIMFIIFIFECASCIVAVINRDYLVGNSNLVKQQMLQYYAQPSDSGSQITTTWNTIMQNVQCCGTDAPLDWVQYNSTFNQLYGTTYSWPLQCCTRISSFDPADPLGCMAGLSSSMFTQGCFSYIQSKVDMYTWAVSWYGFSVQMFVFFLLLIAMLYYILME